MTWAKSYRAMDRAAIEATAAAEVAARVALNTHPVEAIEASHQHLLGEVDFATQTRLLLELSRDGQPSRQTLERAAEQLGQSVDDAIETINRVNTGTSLQMAALCNARGVDPVAFSEYMKANRATEMFRCVQIATQDRDLERAWGVDVEAFKARGQR
jgi:hypothetical protein